MAQVPVKTETAAVADYGQEEVGGTVAQYGEEETYLEGDYGDTGYGDYTMDQEPGLAGETYYSIMSMPYGAKVLLRS